MDLKLNHHRFLVTGASSGFGRAIAERLLNEGAEVIAVARRAEKLDELLAIDRERVTTVTGDLTEGQTHQSILNAIGGDLLHGVVLNAGGPPANGAMDTPLEQWDEAYQLVLRWKVKLARELADRFRDAGYGRILFIESASIKQPIPDLVLSNAFRAAVAGFAKTLSGEVAPDGVTVNVMAPGAHKTPAIERVIQKRADNQNKDTDEARKEMARSIPVRRLGEAHELASLAAWLLSPHAGYVTGQTLSHDGGRVDGLFG